MELNFTVINEQRLDLFLKLSFEKVSKNTSRNYIQGLILSNSVKLNGNLCNKPSTIVKINDYVSVCIKQERKNHELKSLNIDLEIIYEDYDMIVINKQANLVVHPASGHEDSTLLNGLIYHCRGEERDDIVTDDECMLHDSELADSQCSEFYSNIEFPALVHRLDKDTTGVMVIAKSIKAYRSLINQFASKTAQRKYYAFVWGKLDKDSDTISTYIARSPNDRKKMTVLKNSGKMSITHYQVKKVFDIGNRKFISLIECSLETGRTHQIRVHMKYIGHPVVGDQSYFSAISENYSDYLSVHHSELNMFIQRQALHSHYLKLHHPISDKQMSFEAKIPSDMKALYNFCNTIF